LGQGGPIKTASKWRVAAVIAAAPVVGGVIFLIVWEALVAHYRVSRFILPPLSKRRTVLLNFPLRLLRHWQPGITVMLGGGLLSLNQIAMIGPKLDPRAISGRQACPKQSPVKDFH
jgi:hypothetical protein